MTELEETDLPEQWIEIDETFETATGEADLLAAFRRRYEAALRETSWSSLAVHTPGCLSRTAAGECDCEVEVHVFQPALRRRIRLRGHLPGRLPAPQPEAH
jgi:hypothetical protein